MGEHFGSVLAIEDRARHRRSWWLPTKCQLIARVFKDQLKEAHNATSFVFMDYPLSPRCFVPKWSGGQTWTKPLVLGVLGRIDCPLADGYSLSRTAVYQLSEDRL